MAVVAARLQALLDRGLARFEDGDVDGALAAWYEAVALDPDDGTAAAYIEHVRAVRGAVAAPVAPSSDRWTVVAPTETAAVPASDPRCAGGDEGGVGDDVDVDVVEVLRAALDAGDATASLAGLGRVVDAGPTTAIPPHDLARLERALLRELGGPARTPARVGPLDLPTGAGLDARTAFVASRIDGVLTLAELLDVAGMGRLEALYRLTLLVRQGIVAVR